MNSHTSATGDPSEHFGPAEFDFLRAENERLKTFVYRASHDLKSPLRALIALAEWIVEDLEETFGKLPENIASDLNEISTQSARMSKLISDLLELSQLGHHDDEPPVCDARSEILDCVKLCAVPDGFDIRLLTEFPLVACTPVEFALMIRNLLNNSIEHHDRPTGVIEISSWQEDGFCYFSVRDDGPGIESDRREEIFEMFKKLARSKGSGIGLGMVRQIAEQYGGVAYVRAVPEKRGSDFVISLPLADAAKQQDALPDTLN